MNVVRVENTLGAARGRGGRGRGRGRGRGKGSALVTSHQINTVLPKYDFKTERRPLINLGPSSSSTARTPRNVRRGQTTHSSSILKSGRGHRSNESSAQTSPRSISSASDHCIILAITSGRGDARGEVGMAAIDIQYPHMVLSQISDSHAYANTLSKINALQPIEVIMPDTMCEGSIYPNGLYRAIKEKFEGLSITGVARMHFHDSAGMDRINTHCAEEFSTVKLLVKQKYYALAAASALLKYIEYIQHIVYAPKSMRIDYQGSHNTAMIDIESAQSLELVTSQGGGGNSLLSSLDRCSTPMGRRLLRASILQPPCNLNLIENRQACVTEFVTNKSLNSILQPVIKRLFGASRLLSLAVLTSQADNVKAAEKNLNYILLLKNIIDIIPELRSVIAVGEAPFFRKVHEDLKDPRYETIKDKILTVIHADARCVLGFTSSNMQRCFAIRAGINDMLDVARQTYCELIDDMQILVEKFSHQYKLPLSLGCNATLGYHIEMDAPRRSQFNINDLPDEFIEVHKNKGTIYMTTEYLVVLSRHCIDASEELHLMSNVVLNETLSVVRDYIGCLLILNDNVAELDLLLSLAQVSTIPDYVRPVFGNKLELINSRHPIMDIWRADRPICNDIVASSAYNFHTIMGPNMSGKSVYLKQIVLLQIMGQIGCYVPATSAELRMTDRIFCRLSSTEDIECDDSTFVHEIKEAQNILQWVTPTSLIILDELCRSTTVEEGVSIAWAICEKLLLTTDAFVFNVTHFLHLLKLSELYCNVTNHYFETQVVNNFSNGSRLIYTHNLKLGIAPVMNYGITLARSTRLLESIVSLAQQYAETEIAKIMDPLMTEVETNSSKKSYYDCVVRVSRLLERNDFTVSNVVKLVNAMKIQDKFGKTIVLTEEEVTSEDQKNLAYSLRSSAAKTIVERQPSKRASTTIVFSNREESKKARLDTSEITSSALPSSFTKKLVKSLTSEQSQTKISGVPEDNVSYNRVAKRNLSTDTLSIDALELEAATSNSESEDEVSKVSSADLIDTSQLRCSGTSQLSYHSASSEATLIAQRNAREKEAKIFKQIEGSDFNQAAFFDSFHSTVTIGSSDED